MATLSPHLAYLNAIAAGEPPVGEQSNLVNPPSQSVALYHVNGIALICMLAVVGCRFWIRTLIQKCIRLDDWFCLGAVVGSITHTSLILAAIPVGLGIHIWNIPISVIADPNNVRLFTSIPLVYPITVCLLKISILWLYVRIFDQDRLLKQIVTVSTGCLTMFYFAYVCIQVVIVAECTSLSAAYQYPVCQNMYAITLFESSVNMITDFYVLLLPIRNIMSLGLPRGQRIWLGIIFFLGLGACAIAVARLAILAQTAAANDPWNGATIANLSVVEIDLALILSCIPILPYFKTHNSRRPTPQPMINLPSQESLAHRPPPPSKEASQSPVAPPPSRTDHYSASPQRASSTSPRRALSPALARALSPDRDQYVELEDSSPISPLEGGRIELASMRTPMTDVFEIDAHPMRSPSAARRGSRNSVLQRWYHSGRNV